MDIIKLFSNFSVIGPAVVVGLHLWWVSGSSRWLHCDCNTSVWSHPSGGFISFNGSWRVQGILAMSRSLGDYPLKNLNVVIPDPDILTFDLDKLQPEFMILASDGLWDAFSNEEAVRFVRERLDEPHFGAKSIVLQSFYRGCPDNITVMVVKFKNSSGSKTGE